MRLTTAHYQSGRRIEYAYDLSGNLLARTLRNFVDTDHDGLDDNWERTNFGSLERDGRSDFDNDQSSDLAEFLAETNPKDSNSVLRVLLITAAPATGAQIQWPSQAGLRYRLEFTDSMTSPIWRQLGNEIIATSTTGEIDDHSLPLDHERFYRIVLVR